MLYIHIGAQKTGSTTIQKALYDNRAQLRKNGLTYVDVLPEDTNKVSHYNSVRGFFSAAQDEVGHTERFVAQIKDPRQDYLISAENLSNWPAMRNGQAADDYVALKRQCLTRIRAAFSGHEVTVVLCIRNRCDYLKSLFKQHLKVNIQMSRSLDHSLHQFLNRELVRSDFAQESALWREFFPRVREIDFDAHRRGTLVAAFLEAIDHPEIDLADVVDQNISPDWTSLEAQRVLISTGAKQGEPDPAKRARFNEMVETYVSNIIRSRCSQPRVKAD